MWDGNISADERAWHVVQQRTVPVSERGMVAAFALACPHLGGDAELATCREGTRGELGCPHEKGRVRLAVPRNAMRL